MRRDFRPYARWKFGKAEQDHDGLLVEISENQIQICRHFSGSHCCQSVSFLAGKEWWYTKNFVTNTLRRSVLRFWAGVPLQENAEKASHRDFLRASKLRSLSCGSLDKRVCDTSDLGSFDWSMQKYWDIRWSTNLLKLECERIRSQRARFCPGNLGGIPSMWT